MFSIYIITDWYRTRFVDRKAVFLFRNHNFYIVNILKAKSTNKCSSILIVSVGIFVDLSVFKNLKFLFFVFWLTICVVYIRTETESSVSIFPFFGRSRLWASRREMKDVCPGLMTGWAFEIESSAASGLDCSRKLRCFGFGLHLFLRSKLNYEIRFPSYKIILSNDYRL